ncbi:PAS domain-containing sensor histidine kinase [Massilia sp. Leaf139]|uniref:sensor histidine kinase n=1 Tax=Massilia sp. Leaf139 TaxID=1736272 RepID=UPI0006FF4E61|nr:ATP-binding protein [Massilia sp. Leaf139]KQQ96928.1 histidine kinase [Massilia sp. Leaf139]
MASSRLRWTALGAVLALVILAGMAGAASAAPRLLTLCALAAVAPAWLLWRVLARLAAPPVQTAAPQLPPLAQAGQALALEARLEHAPVALFVLAPANSPGEVAPLNANARQLIAPGRVADRAQLFALLAAQPASGRALIAFDTERGSERAMVAVSALTLEGRAQRIAALLPVESELESETLNAWRQLVQVLTHEIMNSLTPVASLSATAQGLLAELQPRIDDEAGADLQAALDAIARRAASLADFVGSYRSLSGMAPPAPERIELAQLFARLATLVGPAWRERGGELRVLVEPGSLALVADAGQLEQALINLLKNALEATAGMAAPQATVHARLVRGARLRIDVSDNGPGVPEALLANIFTPFFTTKKGGRGIGLALVRQLVHNNGGTVRHVRPVTGGARFVLSF